ncbi:TPA: hypothetical protein ACNEZ6_004402, partial [Escherichia coli]
MVIYTDTLLHYSPETTIFRRFFAIFDKKYQLSRFALSPYITGNSGDLLASIFMPHLPSGVASDSQYVRVEKSDYFHWVIYRHRQIKESFYCMAIKLEIKNLYKIFGEHPQRA